MWSAKRIVAPVLVIAAYLLRSASAQIPKPDTVLVPVPFDRLAGIRWTTFEAGRMTSTCGTFTTYGGRSDKAFGRWYIIYTSNVINTTKFCSPFTNVQNSCGCFGIDFSMAFKHDVVSLVIFSSNIQKEVVTYEMTTATVIEKSRLNFDQIIIRGFTMKPNAKLAGTGGYIIPTGAVVDTDDFQTYMIVLFCLEGATAPVVMVLVNALPMMDASKNAAVKYLKENNLDKNLLYIDHANCKYAQNIVTVR